MRRIILLTVALCMLCCCALGDTVSFLPNFPWEALETQPLEINATVELTAWVPLGEERLADMTRLMRHLRFQLQREIFDGECWESTAVRMDGSDLFRVTQVTRGEDTAIQVAPATDAWAAQGGDARSILLGLDSDPDLFGLTGGEGQWLSDADALAGTLLPTWEERFTARKAKTNVKGYGTATKTFTMTVKKAEAETWGDELAALCPDGPLMRLLEELTFSGAQKVTLLTLDDGTPVKLTYTGRCGPDSDSLREVTLNWSMKRSDTEAKDSLTLKSPALRGSDRDTLTLSRSLADKDGTAKMSLALSHDYRRGGLRTIIEVDAELTRAGDSLSGTASVARTFSGDEEGEEKWILTPDAVLTWNSDSALLNGRILWDHQMNGHTATAGILDLQTTTDGSFDWSMPAMAVPLDTLDEAALEQTRTALVEKIASELVKRAMSLPAEDALYFSRGLESWNEIMAAYAPEEQAAEEENWP